MDAVGKASPLKKYAPIWQRGQGMLEYIIILAVVAISSIFVYT